MCFELKRGDGDKHHVGAREQVLNLGPSHVGEIVLDLLLVPQRIGLSVNDGGRDQRGEKREGPSAGDGRSHSISNSYVGLA